MRLALSGVRGPSASVAVLHIAAIGRLAARQGEGYGVTTGREREAPPAPGRDQDNLEKVRRAARMAMGASSNSPPGRRMAAIQNKAVRRELMGRIFPVASQAACEMAHG